MEKIIIHLSEDWHNFSSETLWGEKINIDIYKIDSIPFFAHSISLDDIVKVIIKIIKGSNPEFKSKVQFLRF